MYHPLRVPRSYNNDVAAEGGRRHSNLSTNANVTCDSLRSSLRSSPPSSLRSSPPSSQIPLDISIDGPGHSGISSTSFTRILNRRLPSLRPMVLVLKEVLRRKGLNDPFEGGMGSYGLVLMVTFLLLKQRRLLNRQEEDKSRTASGDHTSPSGHHHHHGSHHHHSSQHHHNQHHNHSPGGPGHKKSMAKVRRRGV